MTWGSQEDRARLCRGCTLAGRSKESCPAQECCAEASATSRRNAPFPGKHAATLTKGLPHIARPGPLAPALSFLQRLQRNKVLCS